METNHHTTADCMVCETAECVEFLFDEPERTRHLPVLLPADDVGEFCRHGGRV